MGETDVATTKTTVYEREFDQRLTATEEAARATKQGAEQGTSEGDDRPAALRGDQPGGTARATAIAT